MTIYNDCHGKEYMQKLGKCYAVILPLYDENISSGQLVVLQAMMLGKPVIVTRNKAILDYIVDGYNGYVIDKNRDSLIKAIELIQDKDIYERLSHNARNLFKKDFGMYSFGVQVRKVIEEI